MLLVSALAVESILRATQSDSQFNSIQIQIQSTFYSIARIAIKDMDTRLMVYALGVVTQW